MIAEKNMGKCKNFDFFFSVYEEFFFDKTIEVKRRFKKPQIAIYESKIK